jgi:hypothetical protein
LPSTLNGELHSGDYSFAFSALSIKSASNRNTHKFFFYSGSCLGVVESPRSWPPVSATLATRGAKLVFAHQIGDQFFLNLDSVKEK